MLQPVAHHQKVDMEQKIVDRNLVEHFLRDGDVRGFVLDDHAGLQLTGVEYTVGAQHLVPQKDPVPKTPPPVLQLSYALSQILALS